MPRHRLGALRPLMVAIALLATAPVVAAEDATALIESLGLVAAEQPVRERAGWRKPRRIVVGRADEARVAWLREVAPGVELVAAPDHDSAIAAAAGADAVINYCSAELLEAAPDLEWIQIASSGAERCLSAPGVRERGLLVTNMQRVRGPAIAEHVMALVLAHARGLDRFLAQQRDGAWDDGWLDERPMIQLQGKTLLVVGLGGIGTEVARRGHAFGMRVLATRASSREGPDFVERVGLPGELPRLLPEADVVVNATPLTAATEGMFDREAFAAMKPGAFFVNVGRGRTVVTADLVAALESGRLAGAGLDVTDPEPLPAGHPLWRTPGVIVTPHVASESQLEPERFWGVIRENLRRYVAGEPMLSVVDLARGY